MLPKHCRLLQKASSAQFICNKMELRLIFLVAGNGIEINGLDEDLIIELEQRRPLNPPTGKPTWVYQ